MKASPQQWVKLIQNRLTDMKRNSFLAKSTIVAVIAGLSMLNTTRIQAHTLKEEAMEQPAMTKQAATNSKISFLAPQPQLSVQTLLPTDNFIAQAGWQVPGFSKAYNKKLDFCLFGDSISKQLGDTLGEDTFNFALGGMTTVSLVEQLETLAKENVKCKTAIIAMGTNDAQDNISDSNVVKNLKDSISILQGMGARKVFLIPAFYSTVEASYNPNMAGSIAKVEEINAFIRQVAAAENVNLFEKDLQPLYAGQALRKDLTIDGVHLNDQGQNVYRQALLKIIK